MRSLSVDHGTNRCGFCVMDDGKYIMSGVWDLSKTMHPQVLLEFHDRLCEVLIDYKPKLFVFEKQVSIINHHSTALLYHLNAVEYLFALQNNVAFHQYTASEWRKLIGCGGQEKLEIAYFLAEKFNLDVDKICVPIRYKKDSKGGKAGTVREYLCDESDSIAINLAYWNSVRR